MEQRRATRMWTRCTLSFLPKQLECLGRFSESSRACPRLPKDCGRAASGSGPLPATHGPMLDFLVERAREQGFVPDCAVCPEDVPGGGRPAPWMCYLNAIRLEVSPLWSMVKIGDTPSDIEEGLNAGMWTIGVTRTGNEAGLTEEEWNSATVAEQREVLARARKRLLDAGAHYLVESAGECLDVIDEIAGRISVGRKAITRGARDRWRTPAHLKTFFPIDSRGGACSRSPCS